MDTLLKDNAMEVSNAADSFIRNHAEVFDQVPLPGALVGFRGDGERAQATSASIKEPSKAFPRLRTL